MQSTTLLYKIAPKRILIAEDDAMTAQALRMALIVDGHQVETVDSPEQALVKFEAEEHDLVIADFKLPGMDGLELAAGEE